VVGGAPKYIWVNRVFAAISGLRDGNESAWPTTDSAFQGWIPDDDEKGTPSYPCLPACWL
ncbi:unnamed protein product, partial [Ectocarpus sp. 4 AP-2014]